MKISRTVGIFGVLLLALVSILIGYNLRDTPEKQVRELIFRLTWLGNKTPDENPAIAALKMRDIDQYFAPTTEFQLGLPSMEGKLTPKQIAGDLLRFKTICRKIQLSAEEITISFPHPDQAVVTLAGFCYAEAQAQNDTIDEERDVTLNIRRFPHDQKWRVTRAEFEKVVQK